MATKKTKKLPVRKVLPPAVKLSKKKTQLIEKAVKKVRAETEKEKSKEKKPPVFVIKQTSVYEVTSTKLESFIEAVYGHSFSIQADLECSDDTDLVFDVDELVECPEDVEEWKEDGTIQSVFYSLMNDMAARGLIPTGRYVVQGMFG